MRFNLMSDEERADWGLPPLHESYENLSLKELYGHEDRSFGIPAIDAEIDERLAQFRKTRLYSVFADESKTDEERMAAVEEWAKTHIADGVDKISLLQSFNDNELTALAKTIKVKPSWVMGSYDAITKAYDEKKLSRLEY